MFIFMEFLTKVQGKLYLRVPSETNITADRSINYEQRLFFQFVNEAKLDLICN